GMGVRSAGTLAAAGAVVGPLFRFDVGDRVRVVTHPAQPWATVTARWAGDAGADTYGEHIYAVSGFVTRQRESSLAGEGFVPLSLDALHEWRMAGRGHFRRAGPSMVESDGGPGILWHPRADLADFLLLVDWRLSSPTDDSGVYVRMPPLGDRDPETDLRPAIEEGREVQVDDRGVDPERGVTGSARHVTGAIYGRAPATARASRPVGEWNTFAIEARGAVIRVRLNGVEVCVFEGAGGRRHGHVGLQAHHPGSRVGFRNLQVRRGPVLL
ncbi:MAG TPA: DUF1080 domain-containing protein, partial [Candidatus Tectomicrobia bacterium]|nr:DUF1080 domain-containing protein [Candidatus Tectomicrobia bacterium]